MLLIQPSEEMSKQIRMELNENVATRDKDVEIIKEWLSKQPHLPQFDGNYISIDNFSLSATNFEIFDHFDMQYEQNKKKIIIKKEMFSKN